MVVITSNQCRCSREVNEDSILSLLDVQLWAVADGMGGYEAGNVASDMILKALESLDDKTSLNQLSLNDLVDNVEDCLIDVNKRMLEYSDIVLEGRTLGSTVVTLLIKGNAGICLWAGDSRLYRYRNNQLVHISCDHSQVKELLNQGLITEQESENHPNSNVITRAIGANSEIFSTQLGDTFLLCSDGLYNMVPNEKIANALAEKSTNEAVDLLIQKHWIMVLLITFRLY